MATTTSSAALVPIEPVFTRTERLALAGFLAGYTGLTREAYALDLRQYTAWCQQHHLRLFQARRADIEYFARDLEARGRARATITRRLCTVAGFYRYAVEEELLDHSPATHVRRPRLDYESHATGLDRNELGALPDFLKDWEYWCSELLESHIAYPTVAFFRSQHQRQSWVSALTTILDLSALIEVGLEGVPTWQAHVTFAMARHTAVDLTQVLHADLDMAVDRLPAIDLEELRRQIESVGLRPARSPEADRRLLDLRRSYEPYVSGLARAVMMPTPPWWHRHAVRDNWQVSPKGAGGAHL